MFFAYCASRSLISADARADLSECRMYWPAPKSASATALKLFEACCARECVSPWVSEPALAKASALSCTAFQVIRAQKLASVKLSSTAMMVNGDFTNFGTARILFEHRMDPLAETEVSILHPDLD